MKTTLLVLLIVAVVVIGWYVFEHFWDRRLFSSENTINLGADEARKWLATAEGVQVVDVRPAKSFEVEHLPGAVNVKYVDGELESEALQQLRLDKPVLIYCDGGFRSRLAIPAFEEAGFREIRQLHRGIMDWKQKGGEIEKS